MSSARFSPPEFSQLKPSKRRVDEGGPGETDVIAHLWDCQFRGEGVLTSVETVGAKKGKWGPRVRGGSRPVD